MERGNRSQTRSSNPIELPGGRAATPGSDLMTGRVYRLWGFEMTVYPLDIIRITANMEYDAVEDVKNVFHVIMAGTASATDLTTMAALATAIDTAYSGLSGLLTNTLTYVDIDFYNITQDLSMGQMPWPAQTAGISTAERMPLQVAALCHFPTTNSNSAGKKYIAGWTEDHNSAAGLVASAAQTQLAFFIATLLAGVPVGTLTAYFGNYNTPLARFLYWVSGVVDIVWSTQRRRKQGVGS